MVRRFATILLACLSIGAYAQKTVPYAEDIAKFEAEDAVNPPPKDALLFVGSSSIRLWKTLETDFPQYKVINRGFGGSQISDSVRFADRIVTPYNPKAIVFFAGTNDIAGGKSAETVASDFRSFVGKVRAKLPTTPILFIAISPAPSRWAKLPVVRKANNLIRSFIERQPRMKFIDVFTPMISDTDGPRSEIFVGDQLHLNADGYAIWRTLVSMNLPKP